MQTGIIKFHHTELLTAKKNGNVYVAMKQIVEGIGLAWQSQSDKIKGDARYNDIMIPYKTNGGVQEMLSLPQDQLAAYLYSINPNKVAPHLRDTIVAFQKETFNVINDYWNKGYASKETVQHLQSQIRGYKSYVSTSKRDISDLTYELCEAEGVINSLKSRISQYEKMVEDAKKNALENMKIRERNIPYNFKDGVRSTLYVTCREFNTKEVLPLSDIEEGLFSNENLRAIRVLDDDMKPYVEEGDVVFFNKIEDDKRSIYYDGRYVVHGKYGLRVKLLSFKVDGKIRVLSENPTYKDEEVVSRYSNDFKIVGRVAARLAKF